ncbi:PilW family protein [Undibacterium pigrum]|uniref:Tfp pilus assembly protein PilW n=1 Tax=Undibacterium pigrum TaxID=401470 RepID=A0A318J849_9BURK|nr:PilW family protein [Undibacterium pigrum]PXX40058.1 Tfp pilus assembly protein PilW [Undibacterium pigrum]
MSGINLKYSQGRSLVELMIAMTIGLIISLAVTSLFVNNSQTYKIFDDKSVMEEDGRMALNMIAYHIRMAETGPQKNTGAQVAAGGGVSSYDQNIEGISGCSGGFISPLVPASPVPAVNPVPCNLSTTGPDSLTVRYIVDVDNSNAAAASAAAPTDCLGQAVPQTVKFPTTDSNYTVENRYYIVTNSSTGRSDLYCAGNGGVPIGTAFSAGKPIMENVIDMKIVYGYDQQNKQSVNSFFNAADLMAPTVPDPVGEADPLPGDPPITKWARIISAKICLVMRSENGGLAPKPMTYTNCSGTVVTAPDKRLYSTFTTVVGIRGRVPGRSL